MQQMQQALQRIDHKIKALNDQNRNSLPVDHRGCLCVNLPARDARFHDHADFLLMMAEDLLPEHDGTSRLRSFALYGLPGSGKTDMSLEFAHRNADSFEAIFWVTADTNQKLKQGFVHIARSLNLSDADQPEDYNKSISSVQQWFMNTGK